MSILTIAVQITVTGICNDGNWKSGQLIDKGASRTPEEDQLFELGARLIEDFEEEHYPIPDAPPHRILRFLMEQNDLRQSDLLPIFSEGTRKIDSM